MLPAAAIGRLTQAADFERVLRARHLGRSEHFVAHHVSASLGQPRQARPEPRSTELSTIEEPSWDKPVDKISSAGSIEWWLGMVVPKRHARRAVTRSLLKRQMREALRRHASHMPKGLWILRLRSPFAAQQFRAAASDTLRRVVRAELDALLRPLGTVTAAGRPLPPAACE